MKKLLIFTLLLGLSSISNAYADFEAIEMVLGRLEIVQKKAQNVQEKLKDAQAKLNKVRQGVYGAMKIEVPKLTDAKKVNILSTEPLTKAMESGDPNEVSGAYEDEFIVNYSESNQNEAFSNAKDIKDAIRREDAARLYALAFTIRTNMAKVRNDPKDPDPDEKMMNGLEGVRKAFSQVIIGQTFLAQMWDVMASISEFELKNRAKALEKDVRADSTEGGA